MAVGESLFAPGDPCGVCQFPTGRGEVCGNVVYANEPKGRLPRYCGQKEQVRWQAQHGTEGNPKHLSDRAKYWRDTYGMSSPEEAAQLAAAEAARRGIGRRSEADESAPAAESEPVLTVVPPAPEGPEPQSSIDALADLATALTGRVQAIREEMDEMRAESEAQRVELDAERERLAAEVETEKQGLAADRETAQNTTERAKLDVREANEARLQTEGELKSARARIAELEAALDDAKKQHKREIGEIREAHKREVEEVRKVEYERFREMMRDFASTVRHDEKPDTAPKLRKAPTTPGPDAQDQMMQRVQNGDVTVVDREWVLSNAKANTAAANTLSWLLNECRITVTDEGQVKPVTLATVREGIEQMRQQK